MAKKLQGSLGREPLEGQIIVGLCVSCKHKWPAPKCAAFPDGIPGIFLSGKAEHTIPHPGDHGIQYEPMEEDE